MTKRHPIATRESLLSRLKDWNDQDSWQVFFKVYWKLIYGQAVKAGLTDVEAQEVVQETLIEISHRIKTFKYDSQTGSFKGWLFRLTRWRIADQFQKRPPTTIPLEVIASEDDLNGKPADVRTMHVEPSTSWEQEWKQAIIDTAMGTLRRTVPPKHFQVFDLLVRHQQSVSTVARILKLNRGYVYLVKFRVIARLKKEIARLEKERI